MPDEMDGFEDWDADEFEDVDPIDPIATPPEQTIAEGHDRPGAPHRKRIKPDGNTKRVNAREARRQAMRDAQGRGPKPTEQWRDELTMGNRGKAAAALSKGGDHNTGSGFGLA